MSASALPLKICIHKYDRNISYDSLHTITKRANPTQILTYKRALLLHKTYNDDSLSPEWLDLFSNQSFNNRSPNLHFVDNSNYRIEKNILSNRFTILNNHITLASLNKSYESYKVLCKGMFINVTV